VKQQHENLLPEKKRVPNEPPTLNTQVFQKRRFRHVVPAGGSGATFTVAPTSIYLEFGLPATATPASIESISAWCFADTTNPLVTLTLTDGLTGKSFTDSSQIGQPSAKASYRFPLNIRQGFFKATDSNVLTTITATVGAQVVIDVVLSVLV